MTKNPTVTIQMVGHPASDGGETVRLTRADVESIAAAYNAKSDPAPIVVGVPALHHPAFGWVKDLKADGNNLVATTEQVSPAFAELAGAGRYKRVAAAFYGPKNRNNPRLGKWYLRHISFHGMPMPETALGAVSFAEQDFPDLVVSVDPRLAKPIAMPPGFTAATHGVAMPEPGVSLPLGFAAADQVEMAAPSAKVLRPFFGCPPGYKILGDDYAVFERAQDLYAENPQQPFTAALHQAKQELSFSEPPGAAAARQEATVARARHIQDWFPHLTYAEALERAASELVFSEVMARRDNRGGGA